MNPFDASGTFMPRMYILYTYSITSLLIDVVHYRWLSVYKIQAHIWDKKMLFYFFINRGVKSTSIPNICGPQKSLRDWGKKRRTAKPRRRDFLSQSTYTQFSLQCRAIRRRETISAFCPLSLLSPGTYQPNIFGGLTCSELVNAVFLSHVTQDWFLKH